MPMKLIPVDQWVYHLWKVEYCAEEDGPTLLTKYVVETDTHIHFTVVESDDDWPGPRYKWARWECIKENVPGPRVVGKFYNMPLRESGWAVANRMGYNK